jgi:hypothetical protein
MASLFKPSQEPLRNPGGVRSVRRPDLSSLTAPAEQSGAPLSGGEIDYDELVVLRSWRSYDEAAPGVVKYFMYELAQRNPGEAGFGYFFKAVRMLRLTRVPRYLRNTVGNRGPNAVFEGQRDVLAALREQQVLFTQVIAKSPELPLVFAYGVQAVGATPEAAMAKADESYAILTTLLDGVYQQIEYSPLLMNEGEALARYQAQWNAIAVARGRPMPTGTSLGGAALLDGNRTDVESTNNQLESFIRAMGEKSFMLTLVTVPLAPQQMSAAWRNLTEELSKFRSDQAGSRAISAGAAMPIGLGATLGDGQGNTHTAGMNEGVSSSTNTSNSQSLSNSTTDTFGSSYTGTNTNSFASGVSTSEGFSANQGTSTSQGASVTDTTGVSTSQSTAQSASQTAGINQSQTQGVNSSVNTSQTVGVNQSQSFTESVGINSSVGASQSVTDSVSQTQTSGTNSSIGVNQSTGQTAGSNYSTTNTAGISQNASNTAGVDGSTSSSSTNSTGVSTGNTQSNSSGDTNSTSNGLNANVGVAGVNQSGTAGSTTTSGTGSTNSTTNSTGTTTGSSTGGSYSSTQGAGTNQSTGVTVGGSTSQTNTFGQSATVGTSQSTGVTAGQSVTSGVSATNGTSQSWSAGQTVGQSATVGVGRTDGVSATAGVGSSYSETNGQTNTNGQGTSASRAVGATMGTGTNIGTGVTQGTGTSNVVTNAFSAARGTSESVANTSGVTDTSGTGASQGTNRGVSDSFAAMYSRSATNTGAFGIAPNIGVILSKTTFNEGKRMIADLLQAQTMRYKDGIEGGAFLYQVFLVAPDEQTMRAGAAAMKAAFWGPGSSEMRLPEQFHTAWRFDEAEDKHHAERERLLTHAQAFTSYRRREPIIEQFSPFMYSSYITPGELSALTHPPVSEALGILAVHDSAPVMSLPYDREDRDLYLGRLFHGERGKVINQRFGVDIDEITHTLITGVTGSGKTTALMRLLEQITRVEKEIVLPATPENPYPVSKRVRPSILALDWMRNIRDLASVVEPERFRFYSVSRPELGALRFNPLAIPVEGMTPGEWINRFADLAMGSWGLLDFGRSLVVEFLNDLYQANRLEDVTLRPPVTDSETGVVLRPAVMLPRIARELIPEGGIAIGANGQEVANVFTCPELSRCVSLANLATMVAAKVEALNDPIASRTLGRAYADRIQSLWRRIYAFAPGGQFEQMLGSDPDPVTRRSLGVEDLVDRDKGMVTVVETEGLDVLNRKLVIGSILLAVYSYGLYKGEGTFDHGGTGPGLFVVAEEANELFGASSDPDDAQAAGMRAALWSEVARRSRALGMRLVMITQNPASLPEAITSNTSTVIIHRTYHEPDRKRVFDLLNWSQQIGQQVREWRYIGEMSIGMAIVRLNARNSWLESAPVHLHIDSPDLPRVTDTQLAQAARDAGTAG